ncbi:MAG: hypothetical protein ACYDDF_12030 [Thermoplasmatota archaeon]
MLARAVPILAAFAMLSAAFAGCLSPTNGATHTQSVANATDTTYKMALPDNRSGSLSAFNETNMTDMIGMHMHDYWNGRTRVDLFSGHFALGPAANPAFADAWGTQVDIRPPPGNTVYEGTDHIEITLTNPELHACDPTGDWYGNAPICTDKLQAVPAGGPPVPDPSPSSSLKLQYITSQDAIGAWKDAGPIGWNTPAIIKLTSPGQADMPHSVGSEWMFRILSTDNKDSTLEFDAKATIVRGNASIPLWPSHPLFYARSHYRLIADKAGESQDTYNEGNGGPVKVVYPDKLVSEGTNTLFVWVNITDLTATVPVTAPGYWTLVYHNASYTSMNLTEYHHSPAGNKSYLFILHSDMYGMDSPYASQSRWAFWLRGVPPDTNKAQMGCWGGCATYDVKYNVQVVASDLILDPSMYTVSLDGGFLPTPGA